MKAEVLPVRVGYILIDAYREEAETCEREGKTRKATLLRVAADRAEFLSAAAVPRNGS